MTNHIRTIVIVSGKGGTGKTTIVSSFASLAESIVLADCDVDAADLHLLLKPEIKKVNLFRGGKSAVVDSDTCIGCGLCEEQCDFNAIKLSPDSKPIVDKISCEGCGVCEWFCPAESIKLEEEDSGEWYISETRFGPMVHARLGIAAENSGRLVTVVRNMAQGIAMAKEKDYLLIDGSPGVGCPVIASITGADYALIITEPTMSGEHDMKRIADLTKHFNIKTRICVNKYDLNEEITQKIIEYGENSGNTVIGKIPFDHDVTKAMVKGQTMVDFTNNSTAESIKDLWKEVVAEL